ACGGLLKPSTIAFGQAMPEKETREAEERSAGCDVLLACGSSLLVYPAAAMPVLAKQNGARLIIINLAETPHDGYADIVIREKTGETLSRVIPRLKEKLAI
ncbi:MAG: NAD-dependent protein deacylase, partial [Dehalococcoidales bacterium]|nr:NAD-dependent protein deacylase [Dehalococcoidales bacterium]